MIKVNSLTAMFPLSVGVRFCFGKLVIFVFRLDRDAQISLIRPLPKLYSLISRLIGYLEEQWKCMVKCLP